MRLFYPYLAACCAAFLVLSLAACDSADPAATSPSTSDLDGITAANRGQNQVAVCHYDADPGTYELLTVAEPALPAHLAHGDEVAGGDVLDEACQPVVAPTSSLGDRVFEDLNANGIQDGDEPGIAGVTVDLLDESGNAISSTTTEADGLYSFSSLIPGEYQIRFVAPAGYEFTAQDQGGDDAVDSDADPTTGLTGVISLAPGEANASVDAGLVDAGPIAPFSKAFVDDPVSPGGTVTLTFTVVNTSGATMADIEFTDDLDAALPGLEAVDLLTYDVCGAGSTLSRASLLNLTNGWLTPGSRCTFSVTLRVPSDAPTGTFVNSTSALTATVGGEPTTLDPATDALVID